MAFPPAINPSSAYVPPDGRNELSAQLDFSANPTPYSETTSVKPSTSMLPSKKDLEMLLQAAEKSDSSRSAGGPSNRPRVLEINADLVDHLRKCMSELQGGRPDPEILTVRETNFELSNGRGGRSGGGSPSGRKVGSVGKSTTTSTMFTDAYLNKLRSLLSDTLEKANCQKWETIPELNKFCPTPWNVDTYPPSCVLASKWLVTIIKLHQLIATVLPFVGSAKEETTKTADDKTDEKTETTTTTDHISGAENAADAIPFSGAGQMNLSDAWNLLVALQWADDVPLDNFGFGAIPGDYAFMYENEAPMKPPAVATSGKEADKEEVQIRKEAAASGPVDIPEEGTAALRFWSDFKVKVVLLPQIWDISDNLPLPTDAPKTEGFFRGVKWDVANKEIVLCIDLRYLLFSTTTCGRYDSYMWALLLHVLEGAKNFAKMPVHLPKIVVSWSHVERRAIHAKRAFSDNKFGEFVEDWQILWLSPLLLGSAEAASEAVGDLADNLWNSQFAPTECNGFKKLERLLVGLLGHREKSLRSKAAMMLNVLNDRHDWQTSTPFVPVIRSIGDRFVLEVTVDHTADPATHPQGPEDVFLILSAPSFILTSRCDTYSNHAFTWKPLDRDQQMRDKKSGSVFSFATAAGGGKKLHKWVGTIDFGVFPRCGFFDWRVVKADEQTGSWQAVHSTLAEIRRSASMASIQIHSFTNLGVEDADQECAPFSLYPNPAMWGGLRSDGDEFRRTIPLQGRFIVQSTQINDEQIHEIFIDEHGAVITDEKVKERGSFSSVAASFQALKAQGITTVQLIGTAARDNGRSIISDASHGTTWEREGASPFAVTCRATPCEMLGGHEGFYHLMQEARRAGLKVFVDTSGRVASARPHRKYKPFFLQTLDAQGKEVIHYGADGRSVEAEDSCLLNYRDNRTWNLLVDDISAWVNDFAVDGVKIDHANQQPCVLRSAKEELQRVDPDGQRHYSMEDELLGKLVEPSDAQTGFWESAAAENYPNPLFVKLCRALWKISPTFTVVGECGEKSRKATRPGTLARSGLVPQLQTLPLALCKIFGKKINEDGRVEALPSPLPISELRSWFDDSHQSFPEGAVAIQSSCSHMSPYPALLYGRGVWPAIDLLFFLTDIPATFGGEIEGRAYRMDVSDVFETVEPSPPSPDQPTFDPKTRIRKAHSHSMLGFRSALNLRSDDTPSAPLTKIRGLNSFESLGKLQLLEKQHREKLGPEFGFDLMKIALHYQHRRRLRHLFRIFRVGALVPLKAVAELDAMWQQRALAFARFDTHSGEFALVVINFGEEELKNVQISLKVLSQQYFSMGLDATAVFEYVDLFELPTTFGEEHLIGPPAALKLSAATETMEGRKGVISLAELLAEAQSFDVKPFGSICVGFRLISPASRTPDILGRLYANSYDRFCNLIRHVKDLRSKQQVVPRHVQRAIESNFVHASLCKAVVSTSVDPLADVLHHLYAAVERKSAISAHDFYEVLVDAGLFADAQEIDLHGEEELKPKRRGAAQSFGPLFFAKLERILQGAKMTGGDALPASPAATAYPPVSTSVPPPTLQLCGAAQLAKTILDKNTLGPIVFVTSELGKWSTVGGLGVMVDELSVTLAQEFGQEVWVISPYYDRNRRGETGYLARDDISYRFNVELTVGGQQIQLGVHEGTHRGVRLFFMHNAKYFPHPYPDNNAADSLFFLTVMGKASLEVLCHIRQIPQVLISNDWPTALIPAFAKQGHFGNAFDSTTFFHIVHNLDPSYEGRIFPDRREDLTWIPGLPRDLLVDPTWSQFVYNPSRCALLSSDAWGTVSKSYRDDLIGDGTAKASPLMPLLKRFPNPFAFPNGIPIQPRLEHLKTLGFSGHEAAKEFLQRKYFGFETCDQSIPLFAFIGRITEQKGVHLITDAAESVIPRFGNKVQFMVGGMVNWRDPYSARVGRHILSLRERYPWSFWASPNEFFSDGAAVNLGADFALMPSFFEPGGIVQHEFYVAGTPVIAYSTGGLKDTVFEYDPEAGTGAGFTFLNYSVGDFLYAIERATRVFSNPTQNAQLRVNARKAVISCASSAKAWLQEFCRLRGKIASDPRQVAEEIKHLAKWDQTNWEKRKASGKDFALTGATEEEDESTAPQSKRPSTGQSAVQTPELDSSAVEAAAAPAPVLASAHAGPILSGPPPPTVLFPPAPAPVAVPGAPAASVPEEETDEERGTQSYPPPAPTSTPVPPEASHSVAPPPLLVPGGGPADDLAGVARKTAHVKGGSCPVTIRWQPSPTSARRPRKVAFTGSFDKWSIRRPLWWDPAQQAFTLNLALPPGKHFYKFLVDGVWQLSPQDPTESDSSGNVNNVLFAGL